jgi:hypothetical protein
VIAEDLTFHHWLCWPTSRLLKYGIPRGDISRLRHAHTAHRVPLHPRWAPAFGLWGAVADVEEIAARTAATADEVRRYAKDRALRIATRRTTRRTPAELAWMAWTARHQPFADTARRLGVLPGELLLHRAMGQLLVDLAGGPAHTAPWTAADREHHFTRLRVSMEVPAHLLHRAPHHAEAR